MTWPACDPAEGLASVLAASVGGDDAFPGAIVAAAPLSDPGAEPVTAARGLASPGVDEAISADHLFRWASVTKAATAIAALRLGERGVVDVDAPITAVLTPAEAALPAHASPPTIRELLAHRGGVPDFFSAALTDALAGRHRRRSPSELPALAARSGQFSPPGSGFAYSDTGYVLVGVALERRTGRTLGQVLRAEVLDPLGMAETRFEPEGIGPARERLAHHQMAGRDLFDLDLSFDWAGGGLVGPVGDLLRLARAVGTGSLLGSGAGELMRSWSEDVRFPNPAVVVYDAYGLGIGTLSFRGARGTHRLLGATGCWGAFAWACPEMDLALAGTVNAHGVDRRPLVARILDRLGD